MKRHGRTARDLKVANCATFPQFLFEAQFLSLVLKGGVLLGVGWGVAKLLCSCPAHGHVMSFLYNMVLFQKDNWFEMVKSCEITTKFERLCF